MGDDAWSPVAARLFAFSVLPVLLAQNVANLLKPALLIPLLIVSRRSEPVGEMQLASFDRWRMPIVGTAGLITAVVGTGFATGWLKITVPATVLAAVLAAGITVRSARSSTNSEVPAA
jgi:hypothetical protein